MRWEMKEKMWWGLGFSLWKGLYRSATFSLKTFNILFANKQGTTSVQGFGTFLNFGVPKTYVAMLGQWLGRPPSPLYSIFRAFDCLTHHSTGTLRLSVWKSFEPRRRDYPKSVLCTSRDIRTPEWLISHAFALSGRRPSWGFKCLQEAFKSISGIRKIIWTCESLFTYKHNSLIEHLLGLGA